MIVFLVLLSIIGVLNIFIYTLIHEISIEFIFQQKRFPFRTNIAIWFPNKNNIKGNGIVTILARLPHMLYCYYKIGRVK